MNLMNNGMVMADLTDFVPGGLRPTDHVHIRTNDRACSRCRRAIDDDDELPLMLWLGDGERMLIYCWDCTRGRNEVV
jgi:hypothetical protein